MGKEVNKKLRNSLDSVLGSGVKVRAKEESLWGFEYYLACVYVSMAFMEAKLTTMEAKVLAAFMEAQEIFGYLFNQRVRDFVKEKLGLSRGGLSNYERYLKGKGYIVKGRDGVWRINKFVRPDKGGQVYLLTLKRKK